MARGEAREKAGFYPIPPEVIKLIASKIPVAEPGMGLTVLDPCMGEGAALKVLIDSLRERGAEVTPFGCELNSERHKTACETVNGMRKGVPAPDGMLCGGAEFADVTAHSMSILYLNPPFDDNGNEQERWIRMTRDWIAPLSLFIFITTESSIRKYTTGNLIDEYYKDCRVYSFPADKRPFNEVICIGIRRGERRSFFNRGETPFRPDVERSFPAISEATLDFPAPVACLRPEKFAISVPNIEAVARMMATSGISQSEAWNEATRPVSLARRWRPLRKLSEGHIANMIAAGAFRGLPMEDKIHGKCLLSGYGNKVLGAAVSEELPDKSIRITRSEVPVIYLTLLSLDDGKLYEYNSQEPEPMERFIVSQIGVLESSIDKNFSPLFVPEEMLAPYLEAASWFNGPGVLPGATRVKMTDGSKTFVTAKVRNGKDEVIGLKVRDIDGTDTQVSFNQIDRIYRKMLPAQVIEAAAMAWNLRNSSIGGMVIGAMGTGKTSMALMAIFLAYKEKFMAMKDKSDHRHTIVIMAPGHLASKWKRETEACFGNFTWKGGKTHVVIPGRTMRRIASYQYDEIENEIVCPACGRSHNVLTSQEKRAGVSAEDKAANMSKRLMCKNENCGHMLIDFQKLPLKDIDEAFKFQGLSVIVLPKDGSKLGAEWKGAGVITQKRSRLGLSIEQLDRVRCPTCGEIVTVVVDDEEFEMEPDWINGKGEKKRRKFYCRSEVERKVRDEDGHVELEKHDVVKYEPELDEQDQPIFDEDKETGEKVQRLKKITTHLYLPKVSKRNNKAAKKDDEKVHRCRTPLFQFQALANGEGRARIALTEYIAKQHRHKYDLLADEVHQYKASDTTQGMAMQVLTANANCTVGLTGTPYGGKASSLFYLMYRLFPKFRETFGYEDESAFVDRYGVKDIIAVIGQDDRNNYSAFGALPRNVGARKQEGNGCDPRIIEVMLPQCTYLTLSGLHITLPPREEIFHWLEVDPELRREAGKLHSVRSAAAVKARQGAPSMMTVWMNAELFWILAPDNDVTYIEPKHREIVEELRKKGKLEEAVALEKQMTLTWASAIKFDDIYPETSMVRQIADMALDDWNANGDRSIVYISSQMYYGAKHIYDAMKRRGLKPFILTTPSDEHVSKFAEKGTYAKAELEDREEIMADAIERGINVLIVNPALVAEGVDLVQFNNLHVCGLPNWSVYKFAQSLARLHRPGQERKVRIHFWAYGKVGNENHLQAMAIRTMSDKVRSANVVTGDIGGALAALNENAGNILNELRTKLMDDRQPEMNTETGAASFTGEAAPMPPLELEIQKLIEKFEDARLDGQEKPKVRKLKSAKDKPAPRPEETKPLRQNIVDDIEGILSAMDDDEEMPGVGVVQVAPDDQEMPAEAAEVDEAEDEYTAQRVDELREMFRNLSLDDIEAIDPTVAEEAIALGAITQEELDELRAELDMQNAAEEVNEALKPIKEVTDRIQALMAQASDEPTDEIEESEASVVQTNEPEVVAPVPALPAIVEPPVTDEDTGGFGLRPMEVEDQPTTVEVDWFTVLLALTDDLLAYGTPTVYDSADGYKQRELPSDSVELPFN